MKFDHEKLDVYKTSIEFIMQIDKIVETLPKGRAYLSDQFQERVLPYHLTLPKEPENLQRKRRQDFIELQNDLLLNVQLS